MKIILSRWWRKEVKWIFLFEIILLLLVVLCFYKDIVLLVIMFLFWLFNFLIIFGLVFCIRLRLFTYVKDEKDCFKSFVFKKQLCIIEKNKPIFYVIFTSLVSKGVREEFIVISNQPFKYKKSSSIHIFKRSTKPLLYSYNIKTQIALPYDFQTKGLLELEKWTLIV